MVSSHKLNRLKSYGHRSPFFNRLRNCPPLFFFFLNFMKPNTSLSLWKEVSFQTNLKKKNPSNFFSIFLLNMNFKNLIVWLHVLNVLTTKLKFHLNRMLLVWRETLYHVIIFLYIMKEEVHFLWRYGKFIQVKSVEKVWSQISFL